MKKKLVVLSGAGMSAESGLQTFRGSDGLWEGYSIYEVATPEAWAKDPALVQRFYNMRRKQVLAAEPNAAHHFLARLEQHFEVHIVTQNVDNLHERAHSSKVYHLHGIITQARSCVDASLLYEVEGAEIAMDDLCVHGSLKRPHIVWFGEAVPMMEEAAAICRDADLFILIGTSLAVYPAASLIHELPAICPKFIVDPHIPKLHGLKSVIPIAQSAVQSIPLLENYLMPLK